MTAPQSKTKGVRRPASLPKATSRPNIASAPDHAQTGAPNGAAKAAAIARLIDDLKTYGGLSGRDIANIAGVSPPTVSRWANGEASPPIDKQRLVAELRWVAERLSDFYEPDEARLWLQSAHPQLGGARAYDRISEGRTDEVLEIIERLDTGAYL